MSNQDYYAELKMDDTLENVMENRFESEGRDGETCPDCKCNLIIETYTNDIGYLKQEGVCPECGYTES